MYNSFVRTLRALPRTVCHTVRSNMSTQTSLAKLRKATGYSMLQCRKALQQHGSNLEQAELWLHEEAQKGGWAKISNLETRNIAQGLIGVFAKDSVAAMIEVNCETDFVARNVEFQAFVSNALLTCVNHTYKLNCKEDFIKLNLGSEELNSLKYENTSLLDIAANAASRFGEKTILRRAVCIKADENIILSRFVHPTANFANFTDASMGRFGAILLLRLGSGLPDVVDNPRELGEQLCQHIVGMNPNSIGEFTEADIASLKQQQQDDFGREAEVSSSASENVVTVDKEVKDRDVEEESEEVRDDEEIKKQKKLEKNETRLLHQAFMLDPSYIVGEKLHSAAMDVLHFERFECGENLVQ